MSQPWQPGAGIEVLQMRARLLAQSREFFAARAVMEVETPVLAGAGVTDPHLHNLFTTCLLPGDRTARTLYLQTSPEYAMKRLLASGSGPIYQVCKVFRDGEAGRLHNPEFTLVEWYRPGFDYEAIMEETSALLQCVVGAAPCERVTYTEAFRVHAGVDALHDTAAQLQERAAAAGIDLTDREWLSRDDWLDLLLSHLVAPRLGVGRPLLLTDYPASQAALARLSPGNPAVAERFEVFINGIEIANGFRELTDVGEQRRRFEADNLRRRAIGLSAMPVDERLLGALEAGLPECAGVALGFDRLLMVVLNLSSISDVMTFTTDRA